jgi:hypothetical protein
MEIACIYFFTILFANTIGSLCGMGGGIIIKPALDLIDAHDLASITFYSSLAVFTMSVVSIIRHVKNRTEIDWADATTAAVGSIFGGFFGNFLFNQLMGIFNNERFVQVIQICVTLFFLFFSFAVPFIRKRFHLKKLFWHSMIGLLLGTVSAFLGIGGGPINVAFLMFFFAMPIKKAAFYSIIIIFFSQMTKLTAIGLTAGFSRFDLSLIFPILAAAILGGYIGSFLNGKLSAGKISLIYRGVTIFIIIINLFNGLKVFVLNS